jgi:predicted permease
VSLHRILARLRGLPYRVRIDEELREEIQSHLEMEQAEQVADGLSATEARAAARRAFGNVTRGEEESRAAWSFLWTEALLRDLCYAARTLRRNPGFTAVAVLTLALGAGATTMMFSIVDAVLLRPLPYKESSRLVTIFSVYPRFRGNIAVSMRDAAEIRAQARSLEYSAFYSPNVANLSGRGEPREISATQVENDLFGLLGVQPVLGRFFLPGEQVPGNGNVAVLSNEFWRNYFDGQPSIIGKTIALDEKSYMVVGVAPAGFDLPGSWGDYKTQVWLPMQPIPPGRINAHFADTLPGGMLALLRPGRSLREANAELDSISTRLQREYPENDEDWSLHAIGARDRAVADERPGLLILFGAVTLLLLIACANVASLLLSLGLKRQREIAIRQALGASRGRIVRQLLTESLFLAFLGALFGLVFAIGGVEIFRVFAPRDLPRLDEIHPNWTMLWFALASIVFAGILFGMAPVIQSFRFEVNPTLKPGGVGAGGATRRSLRGAVVVLEVTLALPLMIGSVLLIESLAKVMSVPTGMKTDHMITMSIALKASRYPDHSHVERFLREVLQNIDALPGVDGAAASDSDVLAGVSMASHVRVEGNEQTAQGVGNIEFMDVSPDFFRVLGIPILEGRAFSPQDVTGSSSVAIINKKLATLFWGKRDPIGTHVSFDVDANGRPIWITVVGVADDTRDSSLEIPPQPELYAPIFQFNAFQGIDLLVRTRSLPSEIVPTVRAQIWSVDEDQPITNVKTMDQVISQDAAEPRFRTLLLACFALLGLVLATAGIYGVVSYFVALHTREIGIRLALGARQSSVVALVMRHGMKLILTGIVLGVALALGLSRLLSRLLFGVQAVNPLAFLIGSLLLMATGVAACYVPARRAMRVDPLIALRYE